MAQRDLSPSGMKDEIVALQAAGGGSNYADATVGAEAANVIAVSVQLKDSGDQPLAGVQRVFLTLLDSLGDHALNATFPISDGGQGSIVSVAGGDSTVICDTDATGLLEVDITDTAGASGETLFLKIEPFDGTIASKGATVTFD